MIVHLKLYATLRKFAPKNLGIGESFPMELEDSRVKDVLDRLGIGEEQAKIIMVNGIRVTDLNHQLAPNDTVVIFPPVGGGSC
ncbi:MAG: MoaD/ThiS family protein [Promethearchaeota archaeon]